MTPTQLRRALDVLGWPDKELERRLGASHVTVWRWTTGRAAIPDEVADWLKDRVIAERSQPAPPKGWRQR